MNRKIGLITQWQRLLYSIYFGFKRLPRLENRKMAYSKRKNLFSIITREHLLNLSKLLSTISCFDLRWADKFRSCFFNRLQEIIIFNKHRLLANTQESRVKWHVRGATHASITSVPSSPPPSLRSEEASRPSRTPILPYRRWSHWFAHTHTRTRTHPCTPRPPLAFLCWKSRPIATKGKQHHNSAVGESQQAGFLPRNQKEAGREQAGRPAMKRERALAAGKRRYRWAESTNLKGQKEGAPPPPLSSSWFSARIRTSRSEGRRSSLGRKGRCRTGGRKVPTWWREGVENAERWHHRVCRGPVRGLSCSTGSSAQERSSARPWAGKRSGCL